MKPTQPTIIQLDATIAERARALAGKGKPLGGRAFGVLHAIQTLWNEQRRPAQFLLVYADVAAITGDSEQTIREDVGKLKAEGLIVRLRHGNQYRKSCWQFGKEIVDTPTMTAEAAQEQQQKHEAQRRPQVERAPAPTPVQTATTAPEFDEAAAAERGREARRIMDDLMKSWCGASDSKPDDKDLQRRQPDMQNFSNTPSGNEHHSCKSSTATCSQRIPYSNTEFKISEPPFLPEGRDGGKIISFNELTPDERPFTPTPDREAFDVFDHKRYYRAKFNLDSPCYPHPIEQRRDGDPATFRNTLVNLNREPREWAKDRRSAELWGSAWAFVMGLNPTKVMREWRIKFEVEQNTFASPTAAFKAHCMGNYETLRMRPEHLQNGDWRRFGHVVSLQD